jgi:hypothetical protein
MHMHAARMHARALMPAGEAAAGGPVAARHGALQPEARPWPPLLVLSGRAAPAPVLVVVRDGFLALLLRWSTGVRLPQPDRGVTVPLCGEL